jgi:hypothetical protein
MSHAIIIGHRRFTCLSSGLVRLEFSPNGRFEDRLSIVAHEPKRPIPFKKIERKKGGEVHLHTGLMTIVSRDNGREFFQPNLEVRWLKDDLLQCWRPGDVDRRNLGGTIRALDSFCRDARIRGVHGADLQSPDARSCDWAAWHPANTDIPYYRANGHEDRRQVVLGCANIHECMRFHPRDMLVRTYNHAADAYRYCPGLLSRSGYFLLNDSVSAVMGADDFPVARDTPGTKDWYFFCYNDDFRAAQRDFITLCGKSPIPRKNTFGLIFSRWPAFGEEEAKQIAGRFAQEGIPLSTLVVDMEWHKGGWANWDWNEAMFPDPGRFFAWCHDQHLDVTLNVHPQRMHADDSHFKPFLKAAKKEDQVQAFSDYGYTQPKVDVDMCKKREAGAFLRICHDAIVKQGMDFWWVDGIAGAIDGTIEQLVNNHLYFNNVARPDHRGMLLSRYGGVGSHRYGVFFTGDTASQWEVLEGECEFNIRAGHLGVAYISHDIGGFARPPAPLIDPDLYLRWLQFGVFNPVMRFHSSPGSGSRQPWDYGQQNCDIAKRWLRFRQSLMPYIYSAARQHHETGQPLVRGLFYDHPRDEASYRFDEFMFGDALLVAPVLTPRQDRTVYLPAGTWYDYQKGTRIVGPAQRAIIVRLSDVPLYAKAGAIICRQADGVLADAAHADDLIIEAFPGADGETTLYEDDGATEDYLKGGFATTKFTLTDDGKTIVVAGRPTKGKPFGKDRDLDVRVILAKPPKAVLVDGRPLPKTAWNHDPATGRLSVPLPGQKVNRGWSVTVRR